MMVGLPASGKSTYAKELLESQGFVRFSSDDLREELFGDVNCQDKNSELFQEMNRRAIMALKIGRDVVYDATNTSSKKRRALLSQLPRDVQKECVYITTNDFRCIMRDSVRERSVGDGVIRRMYKRLQIPMYHEGWDKITIYNEFGINRKTIELPSYYEEYCKLLKILGCKECVDLAQDNPYHTLSISRHMYYTYEKLINKGVSLPVLLAGMLHDIGKPYCKEFNGKYASFKGHEYVSAQMAVEILSECGFKTDEIINITTLIQLHMRLHNKDMSEKTRNKFKSDLGDEMYSQLVDLNVADGLAK